MQNRCLGRGPLGKAQGLSVSAIGLGGRRISDPHTETRKDEALARALIDRALEGGLTFIDTADSYADGENERLFGRLLEGRRDKVVLATKFGMRRNAEGQRVLCGRPDYAVTACEASLARLRTDVIDLYYLHRVDPEVPIEDSVGAMVRLKEQGKIRHIGLSEAGPETLRRASAVHPITALQSEYSLWMRDYENDTLPVCRELGIGLVAYYPLGQGFLAGAIRALDRLGPEDSRRRNPRFRPEAIGPNLERLLALNEIALSLDPGPGHDPEHWRGTGQGITLAQLALAWILHQDPDYTVIPGTSQIANLESNLEAAAITLTPDQLRRIDALFPRKGVSFGDQEPRARRPGLNA